MHPYGASDLKQTTAVSSAAGQRDNLVEAAAVAHDAMDSLRQLHTANLGHQNLRILLV
jgi:hypothetical protein